MKRPPNMLLIVADQLSALALSSYGGTFQNTPGVESISAAGARFRRAYCTSPLCQPSRASFWTGRYPHETGVLSNGRKDPVVPIPERMPTIGSVFAAAGYHTAHFGKTHAAGALRGFGHIEPAGEMPVNDEHPAWPTNADTRRDRYTTEKAVEFLASYRGEAPFLTVVDLENPHNICGWVGENVGPHADITPPGSLPALPPNFRDDDFETRPLPVQYLCCTHRRQAQAAGWTPENYRHYLAAYFHYVGRVDREMQQVLAALRQRPDADQTFVVFFSDHGDGMAAHQLVTKHTAFYEESVRVPFIVSGPGIVGEDRIIDGGPVSLLDLFPTVCGIAELACPDGLPGRDLSPYLRGEKEELPEEAVVAEWHTEWGFTREPGRMLVSQNFKYIRYGEETGPMEELYDLPNDPGETKNLAPLSSHDAVLCRYREKLIDHCRRSGDPFFSLRPEVDRRWRAHPPGYDFHRGPCAVDE